ncbi:MAG: glycosyltransferase [Acidobacteria bacterium]|nr:glycosyltransferase [Acidobacteriota bacterium]
MRFCVIVCTYNYGHLIGDALRTVAAQTFPHFDLLVVDDGSTDNTEEVVRRFARSFRNCTYLKKPHTGVSEARNVGVQAAAGTHIAFLDADDLWAPDYLRVMGTAFEEHPEAELVCCDGYYVHTSGDVLGPIFPAGLAPVCGQIRSARELFSFFQYAAPPAMVFTKSLYERNGPFDVRLHSAEDWDWLIRAAIQGAFVIRLDRKLVLCRGHGGNLTSQEDKVFESWLTVYRQTLQRMGTDPEIETLARTWTRSRVLRLAAHYPAAKSRLLLRETLQVFEGDILLKAAHGLTYLGLCRLAQWGRQAKRSLSNRLAPKPRIDLGASPEAMFALVSK